MGQEASLPVENNEDINDLEEQARAPPSAIINNNNNNQTSSPNSKSRGKFGNMFHHQNSNNARKEYEHKEAARAAAAGGNLYFTSPDDIDSNDQYDHHQTNSSNAAIPYDQSNNSQVHTSSNIGPTFYQPATLRAAADEKKKAAAVGQDGGNNFSDVERTLHENHMRTMAGPPALTDIHGGVNHNSNSKKGLFNNRPSARGMINSMRNLSIGGALRKQKEVQDWEKQWDADDDDEDDDSDADYDDAAPAIIQQHATAASASAPVVTARPLDTQQQLQQQQRLSPKRADQSSNHMRFPSAPSAAIVTPDLLSSDNIIQQENNRTLVPTIIEEEDIAEQQDASGKKVDVQMFLPMLRVLGKGSFGKVVLVQKRAGKERGQLFAMKILKKTHLVKRRQIERTRTERKVLSVVNHPFIMKLHYAFQTPDKLYLVLDYCPGGELFFHLSRFRRFPERVARFYAAELLLAIGHLHKRGIIYRDLKPENVLLDADGHVKLGDFGLAKSGISHPYEGATSMCGTPEYMAPEVLAQLGHGFCVDYWGLGMILYEMMTGLPPWYTTDRQQLFRRLKSAPLDIPSYFSGSAADCVSALLERNPRRRLGVSGIRVAMEHDFFRNISWRALYSRRVEAPVRPCEGWKPPDAVKEDDLINNNNFHDNPHKFYPDGCERLDSNTLDTATQNFDAQFTRMPVESEDASKVPDDADLVEGLDESTFLGFSFDIVQDRESNKVAQSTTSPSRQRSQHYNPNPVG